MEAGARPRAGRKAPAPAEGGAAAQVGQVGSLGSGVFSGGGSDCSLAGAGGVKRTLGLRIQLWEAGFVSQTLPRRKAMEGVRRVLSVVVFCGSLLAGRLPGERVG